MIAEYTEALSIAIFLLGAIIGSFLNVCIVRMPHEKSVVFPASHCVHCKNPIAWYDNIPLVSWILLKGRCRQCQKQISFRYFLVELVTAAGFVLFFWYFGFKAVLIPYLVMLCGFIVATFVDFEHRIIPDEISIGGAVTGVILSFLIPQLHAQDTSWKGALWSVAGLAAGGGSIFLMGLLGNAIIPRSRRQLDNIMKEEFRQVMGPITIDVFEGLWQDMAKQGYLSLKDDATADVLASYWQLKNARDLKLSPEYAHLGKKIFQVLRMDTMGGGDVKLMAMVGAFMGWQLALLSFFLAPFFGAVYGIIEKIRTKESVIAYGPFLVMGALVSLFKGHDIIRWFVANYGFPY